ncbi:MAG: polyprenyl synthetase family protein [Dethiobacteraceae bacterium]|nr:polyprenyl synthetase family protein [Bacillota bacterium]
MTLTKTPLSELQALPQLQQVENRLQELSRGTDLWTTRFSAAVTAGGKRFRPALVLLCGSFYTARQNQLVDVAAAVELIHTASLVHDDIIDHASLRRGRPTISAAWGTQQAVLYGDFLFARAFSLLTEHGLANVLNKMTRAISLMCEGEIEQAARLYDCRLQEKDYFAYIYKKTAYFLSACCAAGAEVCGLEQKLCRCLEAFGLQLGQAFQLVDDLLDITGDSSTTGKPVLQDLREGYLTLPLIKLLQHPLYSARTEQIIAEKQFTADNLHFICQSLHESDIIKEVYQKARTLSAQAKNELTQLPLKPARVLLAKLADYVVQRSY